MIGQASQSLVGVVLDVGLPVPNGRRAHTRSPDFCDCDGVGSVAYKPSPHARFGSTLSVELVCRNDLLSNLQP